MTVGSVPSPRDSGKWPRSWLNPKLSDSVTQEQLGEDGHGAHSSRQGLPRCVVVFCNNFYIIFL